MHTVEYARKYNRKIFCFKHPEKYQHEPKVQGNLKMMADGVAFGVCNKEDIQSMLSEIYMTERTEEDKIHSVDQYQLSFFDME